MAPTGTAATGAVPADAAMALLERLVSFPTESRTSNTDLVEFYADRATGLGGIADIVAGEDGPDARANLHVRFGPDTEGGVLLSGHTDVVPAGTEWNTDPYCLTVGEGGRLHGRGTADMKGFLAVALAVLTDLDTGRLRRPVHLGLSYDEEIGCVGAHGLLAHLAGQQRARPEVTIVGEPTRLRLCTAHSGKRVTEVKITAPSGHSSRSPHQPTAIEAAAAIVSALSEINGRARNAGNGFSTNVGTITGGVAVNVLSPHCALDFECRHQAEVDPDAVLEPATQTIADWTDRLRAVGGDIAISPVVSYPALSTSPTDRSVEHLWRALDGAPFGQVAFGCEAGLYAQTLPAPAVIFGPGDIADAHRPDEFVLADDLSRTAVHLRSTIESFCVEPTTPRHQIRD